MRLTLVAVRPRESSRREPLRSAAESCTWYTEEEALDETRAASRARPGVTTRGSHRPRAGTTAIRPVLRHEPPNGQVWALRRGVTRRGRPTQDQLMANSVGRRTRPVLLVCSSGGHLLQLLALRDAWDQFPRVWVTFDKSDARSLLRGRATCCTPTGPRTATSEPPPQPAPRPSRHPCRAPRRDPHDRRRRRRALRLGGRAARRPERLRRELHPHRGLVPHCRD